MDVYEAIKSRRSIRKYKNIQVPEECVEKLLEAARLAPSGDNSQPWHFILVRDQNIKRQLFEISQRQKWILEAPLLIVCVADLSSRVKDSKELAIDETSPELEVKQIIRDTAIAVEHIVLEAQELGLSTCWISWFEQKDIRPILAIPEDKYVLTFLTVGYADQNPKPRPRKSLSEITHLEKW